MLQAINNNNTSHTHIGNNPNKNYMGFESGSGSGSQMFAAMNRNAGGSSGSYVPVPSYFED